MYCVWVCGRDDGDDKELDVVDKKKDDDDGEADSPKRPAVDEDASQQSTPGTEPGQQSGMFFVSNCGSTCLQSAIFASFILHVNLLYFVN